MNSVHGPILTPWDVEEYKIRAIIREGHKVVELLGNSDEKVLSLHDLDTSTVSKNETPKKKNTQPVPEQKVEVVEESEEDIPEPEAEEATEVAEEVVTEKPAQAKSYKKHKR
jgi:hypothetical protein